jgi:hypothetical protein
MAVGIIRKPDFQYVDDDGDEMRDFPVREGLSLSARLLVSKLKTIARGFMLINGEPGSGKDLFGVFVAKFMNYCFGRPVILDFRPKRLFGEYTFLDSVAIIRMITELAKELRVEGIEGSQDKSELAQFMEEAVVRWLLEGKGWDIFHGAVYYVSELKKVAYNRNSPSRTNKFTGTLGTVWRHLDLLFMGTHVYENELDIKAFLQYAKLRAYCSQTWNPDLFKITINRGNYAGPNFVLSNLSIKPLTLWINGAEPRDFLGGKRIYDLYLTKHMRFKEV